ncbi:MAG TPA: DUF4832 domain-containing protein [Verrucomicrobiae bacterium]|jgi:hypothetical protein|nr:DUF4832 domain-containing protein [Verrucomicrobiae bacterium]
MKIPLLLLFAWVVCSEQNSARAQVLVTNYYTVSTEDFANPERGFYLEEYSHASKPSHVPLNLAGARINGKNSPGNTYNAKISLFLRMFYLDTFVNAPISSNYLESIQTDLDSVRAQGDKAIVRFAYNRDHVRPFHEPAKERILGHIAQLAPLLKKNSDVIAVLQEGFIGAWGEGYYSDNFYSNGLARAQNWIDRADVLKALLKALPAERMIQVRTPQIKQKFFYGPAAATSSPTLDARDAFTGSDASRIGFHNDCYLADSTDKGTFVSLDYGTKNSPQDTANLRNYLAQDTRYVPMGGETCALNSPASDCASAGGIADSDMAISHYSFLNEDYNAVVDDKWVEHGCMEEIKRRLGYRLELVTGIFRAEAQPGQVIPLTLELRNTGFAAPFNPRGIELILRGGDGKKYYAELSRDVDARHWLPGTNYILRARLSLPAAMPKGDYELLLNLPDPAPSLYANPAYAIRLANSNAVSSAGAILGDVWEKESGYHRLHQTLRISGAPAKALSSGGEIPVLGFSSIAGHRE